MRMAYRKGGAEVPPFGVSGFTVDLSGSRYIRNVQNVGTSQEALELGEIATPGYGIFHNLSTANPVFIRRATSESNAIRVGPGAWACFEFEATAPYVIATGAACDLEYLVFER